MEFFGVRRAVGSLALAAAAAAALGCATPGKPAEQLIRVETPGCLEASCQLSNGLGTWRVDRTPGQVTVLTSKDPLVVRCERGPEAMAGVHAPARSGTKGAGAVGGGAVGGTAVGVALGSTVFAVFPALGVIAVLAGVGIGAGAGELAERSQTALRYADVIQIPMQCPGGVGLEAPVLERPRYGVTLRVMSPDEVLAVGLGSRTGALVTGVAAGGQADRAGLLPGDVIIAAGGKELTGLDDLERRLRALSPGNEVALTVWRGGRSAELMLTPTPEAAPLPPAEREGGTVVLVIPADVRSVSVPVSVVIVRVGAMVEAAVRTSLEGVLRDGPSLGEPPAASPGAEAIVKIEAVRFTYRERRLRTEWKAGELIQTYESRATLAFDLQVFDAGGRPVQSRIYEDDDGRFVWTIPSEAPVPALKWLESHLHETAGRLAQQAAADLHRWLRAERLKPRSL